MDLVLGTLGLPNLGLNFFVAQFLTVYVPTNVITGTLEFGMEMLKVENLLDMLKTV